MSDAGSSKKSRYGASAAAATDDARFEQAMKQADDLLVRSLQTDERRRVRRKIIIYLVGGLTMLATLCLVLVTLFAWGTSSAASADESAKLTQQGWQLWQQQNPEEARVKFEAAVKLAPKNTNAWNGLGWSDLNTGRNDEAEKAFKKVISFEPKHAAALNGLGQLALAHRKYDEAEKYLLRAAPQAPAAWYGLARLYLLQGKFDDAKKWAKKIVAAEPNDDGGKQLLAAAEAKALPDELREQIEPATPSDSQAEFMRAWQFFNQGRNAEARELFEKLLAAKPNDPNIMNGLGWALLNSGMYEEAKPHFEKALKLQPNAGGVLNGMARVLKAEGKLDEAIKVWQHMLKVSPGPNAGTVGLADAYLEQEKYKEAVPLLEQLVKFQPQNEELKEKLAAAKEKAGS